MPLLLGTNRFSCLSLENEIALSNVDHSKIEEPQLSPLDVQTLTQEFKPSSPTPVRFCQCCPAEECQLPQQYVVASSPSANLLHLNIEIKTIDTQQTCRVTTLLNSRAMGLFLDLEFVKCHSLTMQPLSQPIPVFNIDGIPNKASTISSIVDLVLHYQNHAKHAVFAITSLGKQNMILGFT
ncbi:hypothetical protein J132_07585 [Termitomyces sp. J132]|nr:hypothetical protein J132_07585 [Termitomyces sp. J132]